MSLAAVSPPAPARRLRLAALTSHPIQYQAPLFREVARRPEVDLTVLFCSDFGVRPSHDEGFGQVIRYDVPLTEGYAHRFLRNWSLHPSPARFSGELNPEVLAVLRQGRFDALWVHGYAHATSWLAFAAAGVLGVPLLLRGESTLAGARPLPLRVGRNVLLGALVRSAAACLYIGEENRRFYLHYGARQERLFFAPYSVDNAFFATRARESQPRAREIRAHLGAGPETPLVLFAGKLVPRKRPADLLEAAARIGPAMAFAFVGDGEQRAKLESRASAAGLAHVHFAGFVNQSEIPAWYAAADLLALPSEHEQWGLVVNEAMACGVPAVVSDRVGCAADLVIPDDAGAVYPCGDVATLAAALAHALDPAVRERWRVSAAARIGRYGLAETADGVVAALRAACGEAR